MWLFGICCCWCEKTVACCCFHEKLWALVRRPDQRITGALLMLVSFAWVVLVTGWIQPMVDSSLSDRFLKRSSAIWWMTHFGGNGFCALGHAAPFLALLLALVSPPGATLGFVLALSCRWCWLSRWMPLC